MVGKKEPKMFRYWVAHPLLAIISGCLLVLLAAQMLIGALSLSALNRLSEDTSADRIEVSVLRTTLMIETGVRLGKPLAQYFGLQATLEDGLRDLPGLVGAVVTRVDGTPLAKVGKPVNGFMSLLGNGRAHNVPSTLPDAAPRPCASLRQMTETTQDIAVPLRNPGGECYGFVAVSVERNTQAGRRLVISSVAMLLAITALVGAGMVAAFRRVAPRRNLVSSTRAWFFIPLVGLIVGQLMFVATSLHLFRTAWLDVTRENVTVLAQGLQRDFNSVLGQGIEISHIRGAEAPFSRVARTFGAVDEVALVDAFGQVLARANAQGALAPESAKPAAGPSMSVPLHRPGEPAVVVGQILLHLSDSDISAALRARALDALTVAAVALVAAVEMLLVFALLLDRAFRSNSAPIGAVARPVMAGFMFAWALPLGFLPLYARSLSQGMLHGPENLLLALPISVEMACGLLTALVAGRMTDRRGWHVPVFSGLGISLIGMLACAMAPSLAWFVAARGLVGLGYGMTWMGLQGLVVTHSPACSRGRNLSTLIAGLFAGHLCGAAVGAMVMQEAGFKAVFLLGAVMLVLPFIGVVLLRHARLQPWPVASAAATAPGKMRLADTLALLGSRDFALLLLGSIIPFSIVQVGMLSFALPLYLQAQGAAVSSVGRVLMIYGLCVIYIGPFMGRVADRWPTKKRGVVLGGVIGGLGMITLYFNAGVGAAALAVLLLALASCCSGASQAPYMLAMPEVQKYGAAGATSVMRAVDKLGQMAGPLIVGALFGSVGMGTGLALTGVIYFFGTMIFLLFARSNPGSSRP